MHIQTSRISLRRTRPIAAVLAIALVLGLPLPSGAELILNAEVRITAEDNVVGLLSGSEGAVPVGAGSMPAGTMQAAGSGTGKGFGGPGGTGTMGGSGTYLGSGALSPGDLSVSLRAELGGYHDAGDRLSFFGKGYAERTNFQQYTIYDQSVAGVTAGMSLLFGHRFSAGLSGFSELARFDNDPDRDSSALGGTVSLRQRLGDAFSLRESAAYSSSAARYTDFSYRGPTYGLRAGYDATESLYLTAGYRFRSRHYQDSARSVLRSGTASLGGDYSLNRHWTTGLSYEREVAAAATVDVVTRNNIASLMLRYAY